MFKTMDGVPVYDKFDIDNSLGLKDPEKGTAFERIDALEANEVTTEMLDAKADKTYAEETRQMATDNAANITGLDGRVTDVENTMVTESELPQEVNSIVNDLITSKIALIVSDINTIVANAIGIALTNYDTSSEVTGKINTALANYDTSSEVTGKINTALTNYDTSSEVTSKINTALTNYDTSSEVTSKINTALANYDTSLVVDTKINTATEPMTALEVAALVNQYF